MKKLLLVLVVVSMAALLFTGCLPTTNNPPVITSTPVTAGTIGTAYTYTVTATDADAGDTLTYVVTGPTGMVISSAGVISGWIPAAAGTEAVTVTVSDGTDSVTQSFTITVPSIGPAEITITVDTETLPDADGRVYVKGGNNKITVTFPAAVANPVVKVGTVEVPMFSVDNKVFVGTGHFTGDCDAVLITVRGVCEEDLCAAKSVVVDSEAPVISLKATVEECDCDEGYQLIITSTGPTPLCGDEEECCGEDDCSGFESVSVKIYSEYMWEDCCLDPDCLDLLGSTDSCDIPAKTECIGQTIVVVDGEVTYTDFFDGTYYVVATLEDKVGNVNTYYGEVTATDKDTVSFMELVVKPVTCDPCPAEALADVDNIIGECKPPATICYVEPLEPCPEVILVPAEPIVGQLVTITIDYADAEPPTGEVSAYVGPAIKVLYLGIPEEAQELVLTQTSVDPDPKVYTATYTFHQAGIDYIYVVDGCGDCTPCKTGVTVLPAVCPVITIASEVECPEGSGVWWITEFDEEDIGGEDHVITVVFAAPTEGVRVFVAERTDDWHGGILIPDDAVEIFMTTDDNMTFIGAPSEDNVTGNATVFDCGYMDDSCDEEWIYVLYGESCCPVVCSRTIMIDDRGPEVGLYAEMVYCEIGDCPPYDTGYEITISTLTDPLECDPDCCYDTCTEVTAWSLEIFKMSADPYDDCCERQPVDACDIFDVVTGTECNVSYTGLCVLEGDIVPVCYKVIVTLDDCPGNTSVYNGLLCIETNGAPTVTLRDAVLTDNCQTWTADSVDDILGVPCYPIPSP